MIAVFTLVFITFIVWQSPLRSKAEYLGYKLGILVIDSCIEFGMPPQGGIICSYKFDPQALWEKVTNPKKLPPSGLPDNN